MDTVTKMMKKLMKKKENGDFRAANASENAEELRQLANEYFKKEDYDEALALYDRAIHFSPELPVLYLNKSLTCLRIKSYFMAYEAAKIGLQKGGDPEKALYRMGMAAYGMGHWQTAANHFIEMLKQFPNHPSASEQLKRTTARLKEQKTGKYDFKTMHLESQNGKREFDVADYKGPIEIANIPGKGRGIIASEDIKQGSLLVVSKAFAAAFNEDYKGSLAERDFTVQWLLYVQAAENVKKNPQRAKEVYDLYSGDSEEDEEISEVANRAKILRICKLNQFETIGAHLFILPSYFNHSCWANTTQIFYGDVMVIHANTEIKKGVEICLTYVDPLTEFTERQKELSAWNFECHCKLCEADAKDPYYAERNQIFKEFKEYAEKNKNDPQKVITKGEPLLKKIRAMYAQQHDLKITLAQMLNILSQMYGHLSNLSSCRKDCLKNFAIFMEYLEEIIDLIDDRLAMALRKTVIYINLAECYVTVGNITKAKQILKSAVKTSLCEIDHFKMLYPNITPILIE